MVAIKNHLIELLPRKERLHLLAQCETVEMKLAEVLCEPGNPTKYVYFPTEGYISLVSMHEGTPSLEVGMVGNEGMLGEQIALGVMMTPLKAVVQGPGAALRISAAIFRKELARSEELQAILSRYLYVRMSQMANSATCVRYHLISPRLARWLLMSQDRAHNDSFHMTHEFMAYMLGVRRVGITTAASAMQRKGLIKYHRGLLTVMDRRGLKSAACNCYNNDTVAYDEQLR
jgi:CRP-like cAMP-binding protein